MRVSFRKVSGKDLRRLNEVVNDPDVARFLSVIPPVTMKSTIEHFRSCRRDGSPWYAIIVDGEVAGSFLLTPRRRGTKMSHACGFGIDLAKEYWGRGLGGKTIDYAVRKAWSLGLSRMELEVVVENKWARRLYGRKGFVKEGVKRGSFKIGGRYHDSVIMGRRL